MKRETGKQITFLILTLLILILGFRLMRARLPQKIVNIIAPTRIKVMTFVVDYGVGTDGIYSLARLAKIIRQESPQLVFLSGVDYKTKRGFNDEQARQLAADLGMEFTYARNNQVGEGWTGNAILSRYPIYFSENKVYQANFRNNRQSLLHVIVQLDDWDLNFFGTALSEDSLTASNQIAEVLEYLKDWSREQPMILVGNFNLQPGAKRMHEMAFYYLDLAAYATESVLTYPSDAPNKRIDYIFCNKFLEPITIYAVKNELTLNAAMHLPLVAHFKIK